MTDATVLADALVEAGILTSDWMAEYKAYWIETETNHNWWSAKQVITDWRVAGKVLESMEPVEISLMVLNAGGSEVMRSPRAIIEAWYEAQNND